MIASKTKFQFIIFFFFYILHRALGLFNISFRISIRMKEEKKNHDILSHKRIDMEQMKSEMILKRKKKNPTNKSLELIQTALEITL